VLALIWGLILDFLSGYALSESSKGRYVVTEQSGLSIKTDTATGKTWFFTGDGWKEISN
jgi:hypothetical protein